MPSTSMIIKLLILNSVRLPAMLIFWANKADIVISDICHTTDLKYNDKPLNTKIYRHF